MSPPKAAALVLVTAVSAAPANGGTNLFLELDAIALQTAQSAVQSALEKQPTDESYFWSVPRVAEGQITPLRTWRSQSGHWCREFLERLELEDGRRYSAKGTRCRSNDGRWLTPER